jgi:hypothetical protein
MTDNNELDMLHKIVPCDINEIIDEIDRRRRLTINDVDRCLSLVKSNKLQTENLETGK